MLSRLAIQNIAVIDKAEITLSEGFSVLTGETGAGKSLVLDAITMVLGGRTGRDIIRVGEKRALCEAAFFCNHPLADETGTLILRRELYQDGRNLCSINGEMVTVAALREVGESLLTIHGQHDTEKLMHKNQHLAYVDSFGNTEKELATYTKLYKQKKELLAEIESLETDDGEKLRRLDMLRFWIDEIEAAALTEGEEETLSEKRELLRHSEGIRLSAMKAYAALSGEETNARDLLSAAARALDAASGHDTRLLKAAEDIRDVLYTVEEAAGTLLDISEEETDRSALDEIEERLDLIHKLKNKYGNSISEILRYAEDAKTERDKIETADERLHALRVSLQEVETALGEAAAHLSEKRRKAGNAIAKKTEAELAALDMEKVRFSVEISPKEYGETGKESVEFFISTNPAEGLKPLTKIASGGELSRLCLALQTVLAEGAKTAPDVMIFDEIDTGISGRAAQKTGEKLHALAKKRQVVCVTHLPQIAARADAQFKIEKIISGEGFQTSVTPLSKEGRITEIARMISGDLVTEKTLEAAEEMLK